MLGIDSDLGRHLTMGNYILDERIIPTRDLFSHTKAGLSRPPYEWLSQAILALVHRFLGLDGVILLTSLVIAGTFLLLYRFAIRRSKSPMLALILTLLAAGASSLHWLPRPHIFTSLLLVIWIEHLERLVRDHQAQVRTLPLLMILWVNLHGGFIFGVLAWIAYFAGWAWSALQGTGTPKVGKNLLTAGGLSLAATFITPDLWRSWEAVLNNRSTFILNRTVETMRPDLLEPSILPFTILLVLAVLSLGMNMKSVKPEHLFLLGGFGLLALLMARNIPLFTVVCVPILAERISGIRSNSGAWSNIEQRFAGFGSAGGMSIWPALTAMLAAGWLAYFQFTNGKSIYQFDPDVFPVQAVNFLEMNPPQGNMFNEFDWGGYLLYRFGLRHPVFLDSQSDFYGENLMREYDQVMNAGGDWQDILNRYKVDWVITRSGEPLADALMERGWEVLYQDETAVILRGPHR